MPYYYGEDKDVVPVYGNSFQFHDYILQARERILQQDSDYVLIIGDDLLLNPQLNSENCPSQLGMENDDSVYLDGFVDVSTSECYRGTAEAHNFSTSPHGLDSGSSNRVLPSYAEARSILKSKNLMQFDSLSQYAPFYPKWKPSAGIYQNWHIFKARVFHFLKYLKYKFRPEQYSYPVVFGYSDIVCIPKKHFVQFCQILEVFSAWRMFVELAIPTALHLMEGVNICTKDDHSYKTGNVWYPQDPDHFNNINGIIKKLVEESNKDAAKLNQSFPQEYLYLHPVKLSSFSKSL